MKKTFYASILILFMPFFSVAQTGTTISFSDNFACFDDMTLTYSSLVAGRYHYVNTTEQLEIVFLVNKWVIRTTSGSVKYQNTTQTGPNPPRHSTYPWTSPG